MTDSRDAAGPSEKNSARLFTNGKLCSVYRSTPTDWDESTTNTMSISHSHFRMVGDSVGAAVVGSELGIEVGALEGFAVGTALGMLLGITDGTNVGASLGADEGCRVGTVDGAAVGFPVGSTVGRSDGRADGLSVGLTVVGMGVVGATEGTSVGAGVSLQHVHRQTTCTSDDSVHGCTVRAPFQNGRPRTSQLLSRSRSFGAQHDGATVGLTVGEAVGTDRVGAVVGLNVGDVGCVVGEDTDGLAVGSGVGLMDGPAVGLLTEGCSVGDVDG